MKLLPLLLLTSAANAAPVDIALRTTDGVRLAATYYAAPGKATAALVLLPVLGSSRRDWSGFAAKASSRGIAVLALDPRGHGGSANPDGQAPASWDKARWTEVDRDPSAAVDWLESRGFPLGSIHIGGASIGASLAFRRAALDPRLGGAVLLSPGDNPNRVPVSEFATAYGRRPVFIASSADDPDFDAISTRLAAAVKGAVERTRLPVGGHGTAMLEHPVSGPRLEKTLLAWLSRNPGGAP